MPKQNIAIFDLDETLTKKGTWGRFVLSSIKTKPHKLLPFFASTLFSQAKYMLRMGPREHVKETMMRWTLTGRTHAELAMMAEKFADFEACQGMRRRSIDMIETHRAAGDRLMIASAAVDLIVAPIAKRLDIPEIVCTKMAYDEQGRLARKLGGQNCYGAGKLEMVRAFLEADPSFDRNNTHITMYSDSRSDLDILRWADVGIAVNPSPRLMRCVETEGFDVQDWD